VKGITPNDIHCKLVSVYGEKVMSKRHVCFQCNEYKNSHADIKNEHWTSRPSPSKKEKKNILHIKQVILADRWIKLCDIAQEVNLPKSTTDETVHKDHGF
jgi:hypothetical protein